MTPIEVYQKYTGKPFLLLGYTDGEAILVDVDGNIIIDGDYEYVVAFAPSTWPITFIDQLNFRRREEAVG